MGASFYGELIVRFVGDTTSMDKSLTKLNSEVAASTAKTQRAWSQTAAKTGLAMQNVGRTFTQYYSLPVTAGLGYAAYAAYNYQKAMIQVKELTGLTAAEAANFSDKIREASAEIGNTGGPQAAAEAYYFLASSGLNAQEAFDALTVAMKANVAGMGDIQVTADVISSAINVYRDSGMKAAKAMDILMRTIEVGKAEPAALSASLGRIMPIANQLGVGLAELGGNVAALTLGGLSSAEAVTSLRGSMVALVSPAKMSIDEMKRLGTSYKEITASIRDKGLLPTLKMLWELTDHNMLSMRKIIPNVRATTGVMSLLGDSYEHNLEVIAKVGHSQGKLNKTYRDAAKSDVAAFNRALNQLKSTFIEVGATVLPIVTMLVEVLGDMIGVFGKLSPGMQKVAVWGAAITAAMFPIISIAGSVTRGLALLAARSAASAAATSAETAALAANTAAMAANTAAVTANAGARQAAAITNATALKNIDLVNKAVWGSTEAATANAGAMTAAKVGVAGWLGALAGAVGVGAIGGLAIGNALVDIIKGVEPLTKEEWYARLTPNIPEVEVPVKYVPGKTDKVKERINNLRLDGKVVLTTNDVKAWEALHGLSGYVKDGKNWRLVIDPATALNTFVKGLGKYGYPIPAHFTIQEFEQTLKDFEPMAAHKPKLQYEIEAKAVWDEMTVENIFEKRPPVQVPVEFETMTKAEKDAFYRSLSPSEVIQVKWELLMADKGFKLPTFDTTETLSLGEKLVQDYIDGMDNKSGDATAKARAIANNVSTRLQAPSLSSYSYGSGAVWGFANGVGDEAAFNQAVANAAAIADAVEKELDRGNSPWPVTKAMGADFSEGFVLGIGKRTKAATAAVGDLVSAALEAAQTKTRDIVKAKTDLVSFSVKGPDVAVISEYGRRQPATQFNTARAIEVVRDSGLSRYAASNRVYAVPGERRGESRRADEAPPEVHYHNHMSLPQGIVVSDVERFSRTVQPYVERGTLLAQRRRQRGRPGL